MDASGAIHVGGTTLAVEISNLLASIFASHCFDNKKTLVLIKCNNVIQGFPTRPGLTELAPPQGRGPGPIFFLPAVPLLFAIGDETLSLLC